MLPLPQARCTDHDGLRTSDFSIDKRDVCASTPLSIDFEQHGNFKQPTSQQRFSLLIDVVKTYRSSCFFSGEILSFVHAQV